MLNRSPPSTQDVAAAGFKELAHAESSPRALYFAGLDYLRFIAALLVVYYHLGYWIAVPGTAINEISGLPARSVHLALAESGWVGVEVFFVISGFVIAQSASRRSAAGFLVARALRLYPAILFTVPVVTLLLYLRTLEPADGLPARLLNSLLIAPRGPWIDNVFWTLGIEVIFYALVAAVLALHRPSLRHAIVAIGLASTCWWFANVLADWMPLAPRSAVSRIQVSSAANMLLLQHGSFFALGYMLYDLQLDRGNILLKCGLGLACISEILLAQGHLREGGPAAACIWIALMIFLAASIKGRTAGPDAFAARLLGRSTYPLYLFHNVPGAVFVYGLTSLGMTRGLSLAVAAASCIAFAFLVSQTAEPRLRTAARKYLPQSFEH